LVHTCTPSKIIKEKNFFVPNFIFRKNKKLYFLFFISNLKELIMSEEDQTSSSSSSEQLASQKTLLQELVPFILDRKPEVRQLTLQNLVGFTGSPQKRQLLKDTPVIQNLVKLLGDVKVVKKKNLI
jgi:hypothetical protein